MRYSAYQLSIQCDFPLPELMVETLEQGRAPDVVIQFAQVEPHGLSGGQQLGPFLWVDRESLWLRVPNVARYLVRNGQTILVDPEPGIDQDSIRVFLLGSALGALLFQRGYLVLHGNAIRVGDQCMVCVGHSGAGKSTLAAGFLLRGYGVLADDVVPVNQACMALPGAPRIKLWQDAADRLQIHTHGLSRIRPNLEKFNYPLGGSFAEKPLPVRWIYQLSSGNSESIQLDVVQGMQRFEPLHNNTYRIRFLRGMELKSDHLKLCGQLASRVRLARVTRPKVGFDLDALIDYLLTDMADHP